MEHKHEWTPWEFALADGHEIRFCLDDDCGAMEQQWVAR